MEKINKNTIREIEVKDSTLDSLMEEKAQLESTISSMWTEIQPYKAKLEVLETKIALARELGVKTSIEIEEETKMIESI